MDTVCILALIAVGIILGVFAATVLLHSSTIGSLRVDFTDSDSGPYLFLELKNGVNDIESRKYVVLDVRIREDLSQK